MLGMSIIRWKHLMFDLIFGYMDEFNWIILSIIAFNIFSLFDFFKLICDLKIETRVDSLNAWD